MPRQSRVNVAGRHYVTNSSKNGMKIFESEENKTGFLELLCRSCARYDAKVLAYCVTDTEYHLILALEKPNLSLLMRQISATYSIFYNRQRKNSGSIWHDRYRSWVIFDKDDFFLVQKYIANVPLLKKLVNDPIEYKFSSYFTIFDDEQQISCFENMKKIKKIEAILEGKFDQEDEKALKHFKRIKRETKGKEKKEKKLDSIEKIFKKIKDKNKRNKKIKKAFSMGYSQNEIARFLGLSQSSISKIINKELKS